MEKLTLAQMKQKSTDYFFSKDTMRFFKEQRPKYVAKYEDGQNYIMVDFPDRRVKYLFKKSGKIEYVESIDKTKLKRVV